jgi:hypothetical protein
MNDLETLLLSLFSSVAQRALTEAEANRVATTVSDHGLTNATVSAEICNIVRQLMERKPSAMLGHIDTQYRHGEGGLSNLFLDLNGVIPGFSWEDTGEYALGKFPSLNMMMYVSCESNPAAYAVRPLGTLAELNQWLRSCSPPTTP